MISPNQVQLIGAVGKDPEIRSTAGGLTVASFSLATNETYLDQKTNQKKEVVEWHNIVAFGKTADVVRDYIKKGSRLVMVGKLKTDSWTDKDTGKKAYRTNIIMATFTFMGSSGNKADGERAGSSSRTSADASYAQDYVADEYIRDEDIPF